MVYKIDKEVLLRIKRSSIIATALMLITFIGGTFYFYIINDSTITASAIITTIVTILVITAMLFFIFRFQYKKYESYELELNTSDNFFIKRDRSAEEKIFFDKIKQIKINKNKDNISNILIKEEKIHSLLKVENMDNFYDGLTGKVDPKLISNNKVTKILLIVLIYALAALIIFPVIIKPFTAYFVPVVLGIFMLLVKPLSRIFTSVSKKIELWLGISLIILTVILLISELLN